MLKGDKITLKPLTESDVQIIRHWRNLYAKDFFTQDYITKDQQQQWYQHYKDTAGQDYMFIIEDKNGELCGTIALYNVNVSDRTANVGRIMIIEAYRGKGYMEEAINLVSNYAFESLHLYKLTLQVYLDNANAIGTYARCGFKSLERPIMIMIKENNDPNLWKKPITVEEGT
jgi:RimJ/RimL family protein N-acetyltransferase